jgi:hypothetical protein
MGIFSDFAKEAQEEREKREAKLKKRSDTIIEKFEREQNEFLRAHRGKFMEKFGMKDEDFNEEELKILDTIFSDFVQFKTGGGFIEKPDLLMMTPGTAETANASWSIVRQNWMILKTLKRIEKQLEDLNKK